VGSMRRHREVIRFVIGTLALAVLASLGTLVSWAVMYPAARGWAPVAITSGSMGPAIDTGDIVLVAPIDARRMAPGMVVVYDAPNGDGTITHRIDEIMATGELVTRGDRNAHADSTLVAPSRVIGAGRLVVPLVGMPQVWAANDQWLHFGGASILLAAAIWISRWALLARFDPWATA
jgi:signal peptidase I